jgi:hypothetical protein
MESKEIITSTLDCPVYAFLHKVRIVILAVRRHVCPVGSLNLKRCNKLGHILFGHIYFSATPPQRVTLNLALYTVNATHSIWILEKLLLVMLFAISMLVFSEASDRPRRRTEFPDHRSKSA